MMDNTKGWVGHGITSRNITSVTSVAFRRNFYASPGCSSPPSAPSKFKEELADFTLNLNMWKIEFVSARLHAVYPTRVGSSGIALRYRSSALLKVSNLTPDMLRRGFGRTLKSFAPWTARLASRILPSFPLGTLGTTHLRPRRAWRVLVILLFTLGTRPSSTFHKYII